MVVSKVNLTAAAFNSSPLWNLTPRRSLNCHVVWSTSFHDSASSPTKSLPSSDRRTSVSKTLIVTLWVDVLFDCARSEEHTSELQSLRHLVCRLLLEKKKNTDT